MQNLRLMGKYPPSQRRRHISNCPPDWLTKLPAVFTSPSNENYSKWQQYYPPLHKTGNETNDSGVLFLFCKKKRKKEKLSHDYVVCFRFAQTLITHLLFSVNNVTKAAVSFLTINILKSVCWHIWLKTCPSTLSVLVTPVSGPLEQYQCVVLCCERLTRFIYWQSAVPLY